MMNMTFVTRGTLLASGILAMFVVGCGGGSDSATFQAPALHTIVEYSFDQGEDLTELNTEMEEEDFSNTVENALLSRHWLLFGTSLQEGNSSLGNSLAVSGTLDEKLTQDLEEISNVLKDFAGKVNLGALVIGDKTATRLKFVGIQSYNEVTGDLKSFRMSISNGDLPEGEGGLMMLVFGIDGANGFAASPTFEIPQGEIKVTFTCWEDAEGKIFIDNILVQADQPAPTQWDCPELMDFFYTIRDMTEEYEQEHTPEP